MFMRGRMKATVLSVALSLAAASLLAQAAPTGEALTRAAVTVREPGRAVLLGAAVAGTRVVAVGERGIVVLSDDDGRTWRQASVPTSVTLTAVRFADAQRGWAVGHGGVVLFSEDGGERWTLRLDGRRAAQVVLDAARSAGDARAVADAERLISDGPDKPLLDLLVSGPRLLAIGAYGLAVASADGGQTWQSWMPRLPNPKGLHLYAVRQRGQTVLLAGEQGLLLLSVDGGQSFRRVDTPYKGTFFSAELPGEQDVVVVGLRGNAFRSSNGGSSWTQITAPMPASITATALTDGRLLAANQAGLVMVLRDDKLVPLTHSPLPPLNGLLPGAGGSILALTAQGAMTITPASGSVK